MRTDSPQTGHAPARRRALFATSIAILAVAAAIFLGLTSIDGDEQAVTAQPQPSHIEQQALTGHLIRIEDDRLVVADGEMERSIHVHPQTQVVRGIGRSLVTDHDLSRLQLNDSLWVAADISDDGTMMAQQITANGFVTRDGVIEARGAGFIDVRARLARVDEETPSESMRIWISPAARVEWLDPAGIRSMGYVTDLLVGRRVVFQGFLADDGTWVATLLWSSRL